jgi:hypothetical protein
LQRTGPRIHIPLGRSFNLVLQLKLAKEEKSDLVAFMRAL